MGAPCRIGIHSLKAWRGDDASKKFKSPPAAEQGIFDNVIAKASVDGEKPLRVLIDWKIQNHTADPFPLWRNLVFLNRG